MRSAIFHARPLCRAFAFKCGFAGETEPPRHHLSLQIVAIHRSGGMRLVALRTLGYRINTIFALHNAHCREFRS
jgi:hypothetical protein